MPLNGLVKSRFLWFVKETEEEKVNVIKRILEEHQDKMVGKFCVYKDNNLRIR